VAAEARRLEDAVAAGTEIPSAAARALLRAFSTQPVREH
jgi:hypothetical protein